MAEGPESHPESHHLREMRALREERDAWAQELFESNRHAAELAIARQALADALETAEARVLARAHEAAQIEIAAIRRERDEALAFRDRALEAEARLQRITSSTSWRITGPLRAVLAALLGRPRGPA